MRRTRDLNPIPPRNSPQNLLASSLIAARPRDRKERYRSGLAQPGFVLQYRTMARPIFGSLELTILLAVSRLGEDAYGLTVRDDISARTGHDYSVGAVYTTLQRLEEKRLVSSRLSEPLPIRGGRARREFRVTAAGGKVLRDARRIATSVWAGAGATHRPEPA